MITDEHADRDGGLAAILARKLPVAALDLTVDKLEKPGAHRVAPLFAAGLHAGARAFQDPRGFEAFFPGPGHAPDNIVLWFPKSADPLRRLPDQIGVGRQPGIHW